MLGAVWLRATEPVPSSLQSISKGPKKPIAVFTVWASVAKFCPTLVISAARLHSGNPAKGWSVGAFSCWCWHHQGCVACCCSSPCSYLLSCFPCTPTVDRVALHRSPAIPIHAQARMIFFTFPNFHIAVINEAKRVVGHGCTTSPYQAAVLNSRDEEFKHNLSSASWREQAFCSFLPSEDLFYCHVDTSDMVDLWNNHFHFQHGSAACSDQTQEQPVVSHRLPIIFIAKKPCLSPNTM